MQPPPTVQSQQQQRQNKIKVFFNRKRPSVLPDVRQVALQEKYFGQQELVRKNHGPEQGSAGQKEVKGRINFQAAANVKPPQRNGSIRGEIRKQQSRDQEPG